MSDPNLPDGVTQTEIDAVFGGVDMDGIEAIEATEALLRIEQEVVRYKRMHGAAYPVGLLTDRILKWVDLGRDR